MLMNVKRAATAVMLSLGLFAAIVALAFSIFLEWHFFPFSEDNSLSFFLMNLASLPVKTKLIIGIGTVAGFWFGRGREITT